MIIVNTFHLCFQHRVYGSLEIFQRNPDLFLRNGVQQGMVIHHEELQRTGRRMLYRIDIQRSIRQFLIIEDVSQRMQQLEGAVSRLRYAVQRQQAEPPWNSALGIPFSSKMSLKVQ